MIHRGRKTLRLRFLKALGNKKREIQANKWSMILDAKGTKIDWPLALSLGNKYWKILQNTA